MAAPMIRNFPLQKFLFRNLTKIGNSGCQNATIRRWKAILSSHKQANIFKKLMTKRKEEARFLQFEYEGNAKVVEKKWKGRTKDIPGKVSRRVSVLNSLLMENIADVMSSGEIEGVIGNGIEITRVKVASDYGFANVYWTSFKPELEDEISMNLRNSEAKLRSILINSHVLGNVPFINFIKDEKEKYLSQLEKALATADYGPDFEPTDRHTEFLRKSYSASQNNTNTLTNEVETPPTDSEDLLDPINMRQDMAGLNYDLLMGIVKAKMEKRRGLHRSANVNFSVKNNSNLSSSSSSSSTSLPLSIDRIAQFAEFIKQKKKEQLSLFKKKHGHLKEEIEKVDEEMFEKRNLVWEDDKDAMTNIDDEYFDEDERR